MKKLALILVALLLLSVLPVSANGGEDMTAAIALVKSRVEIPEECTEFHGQNSVRNEETSWEFSWETAEGTEPRMRVSAYLRAGTIIESVYTYIYEETEYKPGKILPQITAKQAQEAAVAFCAKTNPELAGEYCEGAEATLSGDRYRVRIPRMVSGIPVYNNQASVWVCNQTGRVESYSLSHSEKATFPGTDGVMTPEEAKNAYIRNGYMRAEYRIFDGQARLVYTPGQTENLIDAVKGTDFNPYTNEKFSASNAERAEAMAADEAVSGAAATLTPQERKAVEEAAGLISYETATEKLKTVPYFRIPADAVMEAGNTYQTEDGRYILRINLAGSAKEEYKYTYGELDGETGEILYYYTSDRKEDKAVPDADAAKLTYEAFAAEYLQNYTGSLSEVKTEGTDQLANIKAERTENGIPVYGNGVSVSVDADGKITSYRLDWKQNIAFPGTDGMLSPEKAYGLLFENGAPRLSYYAGEGQAAVLYALPEREYAFIAAGDGTKLNYSGTPFVQTVKAAYTDISGHYAEEAILALASIGAGLGDTAFMPDAVITQAEFVGLVSNCVMNYYPIVGGAVDEARLYSYAVNQGILPADEEAPDTPLTRELGVAYLLRAMEYGRFAEIQGIFYCDFADAAAIEPTLYGYVAIAKGLGLIKGDGTGVFAPKREMTRGEAAVMIYNYLK